MPITTILSDIAGVLLLKDPKWHEDKKWEVRLGLEKGFFANALFNTVLDEAAILGHISQRELLQQVSAIHNLHIDQLAVFVETMWSGRRLNRELIAFFDGLRSHYTIALLSNAWSDARSDFNRLFQLDKCADLQIFSAEEGFAKPDKRLYLLALERLGVQPEDVIFLDDRPENVYAAQQLGFHALLFKNNLQTIAKIRYYLNINE